MAAILTNTTITMTDGSTVQTVTYTDGSKSITYVPFAGTLIANTSILLAKAPVAFANNAAYLAIAAPTAAQAIIQVEKLTRQVNVIIKLTQGLLADTAGT